MNDLSETLSLKQRWAFHKTKARLNILDGSVRSGKTVALNYRFIKAIGEEKGKSSDNAIDIMVGKTLDALKRNVINPMIDLLGDSAVHFPGKREFHVMGNVIYTVGANDERSEGKIRGATIRKALGDELTLWPESFFKMLDSRLSLDRSEFFGATNPDNPNHYLKKQYLDRASELDLVRCRFNIDDNPFLSERYKQALKKNYVGLWYKRFVQGLWCLAEGAIYDFFEEKYPYIIRRSHAPIAVDRAVGIDYGTSNPTVFLSFGINYATKPSIWCEDEYYYSSAEKQRQKTDQEYAEDFYEFIKNKSVSCVIIDPSAASFKVALIKEGIKRGRYVAFRDADNDVLSGIRLQASVLKNGDYAICDNCPRTISEYSGYSWDKKSQLLGIDTPIKIDDHTKDVERYVIKTYYDNPLVNYKALATP